MPKHKHNANEGERCTYRTSKTKTKTHSKRPLLLSITTAFILLSPTASGVALASSLYGTGHTQPQKSALGLTTNQRLALPKTNPGRLLPALNTPSKSDIDTLESNITKAQKQLDTLSKQLPKDQTQLEALKAAIRVVQARLDQLITNLQEAKENYAQYLKAQSTLSSALEKYNAALLNENNLTLQLTQATSNHSAALLALNNQIAITQQAKTDLTTAQSNLIEAQNSYNRFREELQAQELLTNNAKLTLEASQLNYQTTQQELATATSYYQQTKSKLATAQFNLDNARTKYDQTVATYNELLDIYTSVYADYLLAQTTYQIAQTNLSQAESTLYQAQSNYDNLLIPDPNWTPLTYEQEHTRQIATTTLVPVTTTTLTGGLQADVFNRQGYNNAPPLPTATEQPIYSTIVPDINFNWGGGNVLGSNRSEDVIVRFTGNISFPTSGYYQFYSPADDGTILQINGIQVTNDWRDKGGGGSTSAPIYLEGGSTHSITLYYYENGGGANVWLYYYTPNTGYQLVPASYLGTTATTTTTYVEEITYTYETYYTTEVVPGQVAPLINNPDLLPALEEAQTNHQTALATFNKADQDWQVAQQNQQTAAQDSLAGYYNVIDDAQVLNELYPTLQEAQQEDDSANQLFTKATNDSSAASINLEEANQAYLEAQTQLSTNKSKVAEAEQKTNTAQEDLSSKELTHTSNEQTLLTNQQTEQSALATKTTTEIELAQARTLTTAASTEKVLAESTLTTAEEYTATSYQALATLSLPDLTPVQEIINIEPVPIPEPEPEEKGSPEIPEVIENLMDVNLAAVDPTELTEAQAEQLIEAALVVFETAEEGSPEYEQALDALFLAAEQDDIQVDPALEGIPGVGQAAAAVVAIFNLVGNVGADISPKAREKAQTLVVTTLVVGQIAQAAAMASASSGSSFRRK